MAEIRVIEVGVGNTRLRGDAIAKVRGIPWTYCRLPYEPGYYFDDTMPPELPIGERPIICGGRDFKNKNWGYALLDKIDLHHHIDTVLTGKARGADAIAGQWAWSRYKNVLTYPANWDKYGGAAGPKRNMQMIREGKPDLVIAFPGGNGTADMKKKALMCGIKLIEFV